MSWLRRWEVPYLLGALGILLLIVTHLAAPSSVAGILLSLIFIVTIGIVGGTGGWKPGVITTGISLLVAKYLWTQPYYSLALEDPWDAVRLGTFGILGLLVSGLCELLHIAWSCIEERQRSLELEIVERRKAEMISQARAEELHVTLASIGEGVITTDAQGSILYLNQIAEKFTGWTCAEAVGRPLELVFQVLDEATRATVPNPVLTMAEKPDNSRLIYHAVLVARSGIERPIDENAAPIRNSLGELIGVVVIFRDATAQRDANRRRDKFLATLAHELRNPLAPIQNSLQILKLPTVEPAVAHQARETIERQIQQLVRLVDDLLDVSRVMRGKIDLRHEVVELATVVSRAVEMAQPLIASQRQRLQVDSPSAPMKMYADPIRLVQIVANLLMNSAKYTEPGGTIYVTASQEKNEAVLKIRDTGIGIPPDVLPHVFDLFVQSEQAVDRAQGGLGIGLTLVKELVELHEGRITAHSDGVGLGSEFTVTLPLTDRPVSAPAFDDAAAPPAGRRLLVVDDNRDAAQTLAMLLKLQGHELKVAHDGPSALELAQGFRPEAVFLDLGMPRMDGYEVARRMRQQPGLEHVVLAALTGWGQQEDRQKSAEAGFDHHLVKPPEMKDLNKILNDLRPHSSI